MPPAFASTQKKEKKTVRLTCGVRAGRTARSESSARTPANARARNRNLGTMARSSPFLPAPHVIPDAMLGMLFRSPETCHVNRNKVFIMNGQRSSAKAVFRSLKKVEEKSHRTL